MEINTKYLKDSEKESADKITAAITKNFVGDVYYKSQDNIPSIISEIHALLKLIKSKQTHLYPKES